MNGEPMDGAAVELRDVSAGYDDRVALRDVTLEVKRGSLLAIFGPNGGGKSTLLKLIAGMLKPWTGSVETLGLPAGQAARRIAYVPQAELVDWSFPVTVWNVAMMGRYPALGPLHQPTRIDHDAVSTALERVGMIDHSHTQIGRLSGGQRRRAFLARALAAEPELYLLDEPVTGVDIPTQHDLMALLTAESERGRTVIATTHDLAAVERHFERAVGVNGRVIASGPAAIVDDPDVLSRTYGGHLLMIGNQAVLLDDAHHHDTPSGGEQHYHEEDRRR